MFSRCSCENCHVTKSQKYLFLETEEIVVFRLKFAMFRSVVSCFVM